MANRKREVLPHCDPASVHRSTLVVSGDNLCCAEQTDCTLLGDSTWQTLVLHTCILNFQIWNRILMSAFLIVDLTIDLILCQLDPTGRQFQELMQKNELRQKFSSNFQIRFLIFSEPLLLFVVSEFWKFFILIDAPKKITR